MGHFFKAFARRKVVDPNNVSATQLKRCLSTLNLTSLGVGSTLGAGIYVVAVDVARNDAGPSIVISFFVAGIVAFLSGLCYAEFGARVPKAGSVYVYSYVTIGELCAFANGWNLILRYFIGVSSVARAWSSYFDSIFDNKIKKFTISTIGEIDATGIAEYPDLLAVLVILILTFVLVGGVKKTSWFMTFVTGINIVVILFVVCVGAYYAEPKNWTSDFMPYGMSGVMVGAAKCFYAFIGFDVIAVAGEEARNPTRAIPISILLALGICFLAYFGVSTVLTLMWPYSTLPDGGTLPDVFDMRGVSWAKYAIAIGALCGLTSSVLAALMSLPRILFSMASDGLIFKFLAKVNPRTDIPLIATVVSGAFSAVLAFIFSLDDLVEMMSTVTMISYTMVCVCVLLLRYQVETVDLIRQSNMEASTSIRIRNREVPREDSPLLGMNQVRQPSQKTASLALAAIITSCLCFAGLSTLIIWGSQTLSLAKWRAILAVTLISVLLIGCAVLLVWLPQNKTPLPFMVPCVPVLPLVSIFINVFLILKLSYWTWIKFAVWMLIGFLVYFLYGLRNSVEGKRHAAEVANENQMT